MKLKKRYMLVIIAALAVALALGLSACGEPEDPLDESLAPTNGTDGEYLNEAEMIIENGGQVAGLQVIYEKIYTMKTYDSDLVAGTISGEETEATADAAADADADSESGEENGLVSQEAVLLMGVKNNSDTTLDFTFKDTGVDKNGKKVTCKDPTNVIYGVGPGETRYFQQHIKVKGNDAANIDHMSGKKNNKRFKVKNSNMTSYKDQISISDKCRYAPEGVWHIFGTNNSEYTGETTVGAIFLKDGEPVYFSTTPLCNLNADGSIAWLAPGQSNEEGTLLPSGGNAYDDVYLFVTAYTGPKE